MLKKTYVWNERDWAGPILIGSSREQELDIWVKPYFFGHSRGSTVLIPCILLPFFHSRWMSAGGLTSHNTVSISLGNGRVGATSGHVLKGQGSSLNHHLPLPSSFLLISCLRPYDTASPQGCQSKYKWCLIATMWSCCSGLNYLRTGWYLGRNALYLI